MDETPEEKLSEKYTQVLAPYLGMPFEEWWPKFMPLLNEIVEEIDRSRALRSNPEIQDKPGD